MNKPTSIEVVAYTVLVGAIVYCWAGFVPPAATGWDYFRNPAYFALVGATLSAAIYVGVSLVVADSMAWRRLLLALFLAGMPLIYLWAAVVASDRSTVVLESIGLVVIIAMAVFGFRRSLLVLGAGIAAHGIAWDAWHHHRAGYIEPWYPVGCLIVDVAFFGVAAAQELRGSRGG